MCLHTVGERTFDTPGNERAVEQGPTECEFLEGLWKRELSRIFDPGCQAASVLKGMHSIHTAKRGTIPDNLKGVF